VSSRATKGAVGRRGGLLKFYKKKRPVEPRKWREGLVDKGNHRREENILKQGSFSSREDKARVTAQYGNRQFDVLQLQREGRGKRISAPYFKTEGEGGRAFHEKKKGEILFLP